MVVVFNLYHVLLQCEVWIVLLSMALRMCSSAQVLCITRLGSMVVVNMGDSDGSPSPPAPKRPKLGDSPQSSKFGKVRVEWNFSQTLKEIEEKTKVGDEEKRIIQMDPQKPWTVRVS